MYASVSSPPCRYTCVLVFTSLFSPLPCSLRSPIPLVHLFEGVKFNAFNVLSDADVREGVKAFAEWPTIPQLYVLRDEQRDVMNREMSREVRLFSLSLTPLLYVCGYKYGLASGLASSRF